MFVARKFVAIVSCTERKRVILVEKKSFVILSLCSEDFHSQSPIVAALRALYRTAGVQKTLELAVIRKLEAL